ncbi:hypothetical protein [Vibrio paucivorans]|uniref:Uncharacterized protein n=1 Tax=Vibrio paucivorans TaxID=2829489 RepID=A0A9X3HU87_9VIBR|nr:hypothetical protein [Vibrio paucivorans]MCW8336371.1 hypothetical protein [Vibrio paucivorans]
MDFFVSHERRVEIGKSLAQYNGFRVWSDEDLSTLKRLYIQGMPLDEIAVFMGRSLSSIRCKSSRLSLSTLAPRRHKFTQAEDRFIKKNYGKISTSDIAQALALPISTVRERATRRLNLKCCYHGEANPASTISDDEVELIRQLHDAGMGPTEISRKMELSLTHTKCILNYQARAKGLPDYIYDISELR